MEGSLVDREPRRFAKMMTPDALRQLEQEFEATFPGSPLAGHDSMENPPRLRVRRET